MIDLDNDQNEDQSDLSEMTKPEVVQYDAWERRFKDNDDYSHSDN